jgi:ribosomal protein S18 acetylase RimI-like enzyme
VPFALQSAARIGLTFRPVADQDLRFLALLYASTRQEEVAQTGWPLELQQAFLQQQHEAQHAHYKVAFAHAEWSIIERTGAAIGRLYWYEGESDLHIVDITLLPEFRGSGVGGAILTDILAHAARLDKAVTIHVEKNNPARTLYHRLGFKVIEDRGLYDLLRAATRRS